MELVEFEEVAGIIFVAMVSLAILIIYTIFLMVLRTKSIKKAKLISKIVNTLLAFFAWWTIVAEEVNSVSELFGSQQFYYIAILIAIVAIAHSWVDLIEN